MSWLKDFDRKLAGLPDNLLTVSLLLAGIFAILIAVYGTPSFKVATLAWMIAP